MTQRTLQRGDTVLGIYNDMYQFNLPEREKRKLLEKWRKENLDTDPGKVKAGSTYFFPKSNYGEQRKLRKEMEPRVTAADLLDLNNVRNRFITGGEGTVNALRIAQGKTGSFKMSSGGLTHAQAKSIAKMGDDEVLSQIIELQNLAEDLDSIPAYKAWYKMMELPSAYYDKAEQAFIDQQTALRAEKKFPGEITIQKQTIAKGKRRKIIRDGMEVPQVQDENGTWVDDPTQQEYPRFKPEAPVVPTVREFKEGDQIVYKYYDPKTNGWVNVEGVGAAPRWQEGVGKTKEFTIGEQIHTYRWDEGKETWVPMLVDGEPMVAPRFQEREIPRYSDAAGRQRFAAGKNIGKLVSDVAGLPRVEKEYAPKDPALTTDANNRKRFVISGELVFDKVDVDPTTETDLNGRLRFVGGPKDGKFVFGGAEGVPKEYAPKDPVTSRAADGFLYFETGPDKGERVFAGVKVEPKTHTDANGRLRFSEGEKAGKFVFGKVPKEYKPTEATTTQRNFEYWLQLRKEGGHVDTAASKAALWQKFVETAQSEVGGYTSADVSALSRKKVSFLNTVRLTGRMLRQLANPNVLIGGISSLIQGFENITGQFEQIASTLGEKKLLDHEMWKWGRADLGGALKSNITALAYSLARAAEESGGRLSDRDVQAQIDRISNGLQSKSSMASALVEVHNTGVGQMANLYQESKSRGILGTEQEWDQFLLESGTGYLLVRSNPNNPLEHGMGYYVTVIHEDGTTTRPFRTIARWTVSQ